MILLRIRYEYYIIYHVRARINIYFEAPKCNVKKMYHICIKTKTYGFSIFHKKKN